MQSKDILETEQWKHFIFINMKWKIEKGRFDATSLMANINFEPKNDALRYCLAQVRIINYPEFISLQSKSSSYGEEHVHIRNFKDMDWEDKSWAKKVKGSDFEMGEVFLIHDVMGETIIKEALFDQILFDFGSKLIEVYENEKSLQTSWREDMAVALSNLKQKIDNEGRD